MSNLDWRPSHRDGFEFCTQVDGVSDQIRVNVRTVGEGERKYAVRFIPYKGYDAQRIGECIQDCIDTLTKEQQETA